MSDRYCGEAVKSGEYPKAADHSQGCSRVLYWSCAELRRTPLWRSSVCPITPAWRSLSEAIIRAGIISVLCMTGYEPSTLYIRQSTV